MDKTVEGYHGQPYKRYVKAMSPDGLPECEQKVLCYCCFNRHKVGERICKIYGKNSKNLYRAFGEVFHSCPYCGASFYNVLKR